MSATIYKRGRKARMRWSRNAVLAKQRKRMERASSPQAESPMPAEIGRIKSAKFAVKINLTRADGDRIQFTCHRLNGGICHNGKIIAAKSYFRRIGEVAELWSRQ